MSARSAPPPGRHGPFRFDPSTSDFFAARFLLRPGRAYQQAVDHFQPYGETKEKNPEARAAIKALIKRGAAAPTPRPSYLFVNNRLEGNSPNTIAAALDLVS